MSFFCGYVLREFFEAPARPTSARFVFSIIFGNAAASFFETFDLDNPVEVDKALMAKVPFCWPSKSLDSLDIIIKHSELFYTMLDDVSICNVYISYVIVWKTHCKIANGSMMTEASGR